jgi:hypothetical protein
MNKEEVATAAYNDARISLAKTQEKLETAERVVAEWAKLPSTQKEHWDNATLKFKERPSSNGSRKSRSLRRN